MSLAHLRESPTQQGQPNERQVSLVPYMGASPRPPCVLTLTKSGPRTAEFSFISYAKGHGDASKFVTIVNTRKDLT